MRSWRLLLPAGALISVTLVLLSTGLFATRNASANPLGGLVSIAAGEDATCAITNAGAVKCWGDGRFGQLGNGLNRASAVPGDTADLHGLVVALGAGHDHLCAVIGDGTVKCWGTNSYGQLGVPRMELQAGGPVAVRGLPGRVSVVAAGYAFNCAILDGGGVHCWGNNSSGQLGNSSPSCGVYIPCDGNPESVANITDATAIAAGQGHACVVLSTGHVKCWGANDAGQLGEGTGTDRPEPVEVLNISDAVSVAAGSAHTCALTGAGAVLCWGNIYGNVPAGVPGLESGVAAITAAQNHTCVLLTTGGVKCWGDNAFGQLGDGKRCGDTCDAPVDVLGLQEGVAQIAAGLYHTCALLTGGTAICWGFNQSGQLGNGVKGFMLYSAAPVDVVEAEIKPTPTPTPCDPAGCPTATPRPAPPQTGLDFSLSIDANDDGLADCGTASGQPTECNMLLDSRFHAIVALHALPPDLREYAGIDSNIAFAGVTSEHKSDILWPDCGFPATFFAADFLAFGCAAPVGGVTSSYVGPIGQSLFVCNASGSITLQHGSGNTALVTENAVMYEAPSGGEQLVINCGDTPIAGDVDCSTAVNSVDAQLMLQRSALLLSWLGCPQFADVNLDRRDDAVDSLLTLQYDAGLIAGLPVLPQGP